MLKYSNFSFLTESWNKKGASNILDIKYKSIIFK